ncbi:MAG: restriction endonuclease subunit S [Lentisphaeria bacterium]|nr:restriction endonuclease subunit S [Lentisphaeria bacterium]
MSPVFDEAKYRALLEKLEVSEVNLNDLEFSWRIDAEYYQKHFLAFEKLLRAESWKYLSDLSSFLIGPFGSAFDTENYLEIGKYRYVRGQDVKPFILKDDDLRFIPEDDFIRLGKYALKENDVLVSVVGTIGNACIVQSKDIPAIFSCKSSVVRILQGHSPAYVLTYLNCSYGKSLLLRKERGALQKGLNLDDLKSTIIPIFTDELEKHIEKIFWTAQKLLQKSKDVFTYAEQLLLQDLGLTAWQPDDESVATKTFANFQNSGRLDAEYYQPKYDDLFKRISSYDKSRLGDIVNITKSIEPGSEAYQEDGVPFVRVSDITKFGITPPEIHLDRDKYYSENLTPKKDTILLSKDGSVGIAYKVENDLDVITSGALLHLTVKNNDFLPDYLTLVLNSIVVKLQAERDAGGSIIQHWKPSEIENVIIPKLPMPIQEQIASKVQESFALRKESKRLLDLAKHAVEVAIEQGEAAAMKLLEF